MFSKLWVQESNGNEEGDKCNWIDDNENNNANNNDAGRPNYFEISVDVAAAQVFPLSFRLLFIYLFFTWRAAATPVGAIFYSYTIQPTLHFSKN